MGIYDLNLGGNACRRGTTRRRWHRTSKASTCRNRTASERRWASPSSCPTGGSATLGASASSSTPTRCRSASTRRTARASSLAHPVRCCANFGRDATNFGIRIAKLRSTQSGIGFSEQVIAVLQQVEAAYWPRRGANSSRSPRRASVSRAAARKNRCGWTSHAGAARASVERGRHRHPRGGAHPRARRDRQRGGRAQDSPAPAGRRRLGASILPRQARHRASEHRARLGARDRSRGAPELARERVAQEAREIEAAYYQAQKKPRLDLAVAYGYSGIGGDNLSTGESGGLSDAVDQVTGADFPGLVVASRWVACRSEPRRQGPSDDRRARRRPRDTGIEQVRQLITTRCGWRCGRSRPRARSSSRRGSRSGCRPPTSTRAPRSSQRPVDELPDPAGRRGSDQCPQREVRAVTTYRRAIVEYYRATGRLLERSGVEIQD